MIGRGIIHGKSQKPFERGSIVDLGFQFGVGIDVKPLLKEQAFHQQGGRISFMPPGAFTDGIGSCEQGLDSGPVNDGIDLLHSFDGPVLVHVRVKRNIGECEVGLHFFEAHCSSNHIDLKELWHKDHILSNIFNMLSIKTDLATTDV